MNTGNEKYHFDWGMLGAIFAIVAISNGLMMWQFTRLENRFDSEITYLHQRADSVNTRLDQSYAILIELIKNK